MPTNPAAINMRILNAQLKSMLGLARHRSTSRSNSANPNTIAAPIKIVTTPLSHRQGPQEKVRAQPLHLSRAR